MTPGDSASALYNDIPDPIGSTEIGTPSGAAAPPAATAGPTRGVIQRRRVMYLAVALVWTATIIILLGLRTNLDMKRAVHHIAAPCVLGLAALAVGFSRGRLGLGPGARRTMIVALATPALFFIFAALAHGPTLPEDERSMVGCGGYEVLAGIVPVALAGLALRHTSVTSAPWRTAAVSAGIGLVFAGLWALHCADGSTVHVILAHGLPVVMFAALGGLVMSRFIRVR
jgi:hypothetical protein